MAFWRRIHCHFCGARSPYSKSSGTTEFQCVGCEAWNYLDSNGEILDTPATAIASNERELSPKPFQTFTQPPDPQSLGHQQDSVFCATCVHNQHIYNETLSNYLPDEDHPEYEKFEAALPEYKRNLEKRYPQVCKRCAPKAQLKINRADYYSLANNAGKMMDRRGGSRERSRDDGLKWSMRRVLQVVGWAHFLAAMVPVIWHAYGIGITLIGLRDYEDGDTDPASLAFDMTQWQCASNALRWRLYGSCCHYFVDWTRAALQASVLLVWYNSGLKQYFHPAIRIESITGQAQHFLIQVVLIVVQTIAYLNMSQPKIIGSLTRSQTIAAHGFPIIMTFILRWLSGKTLQTQKWRFKGKMMPKPDEVDVLGQYAGPAPESYTAQASGIHPARLFAKDPQAPFPIHNLAPKSSTRPTSTGRAWNDWVGGPPPSPPGSDTTAGDAEMMDIDTLSPVKARMPGMHEKRTLQPRRTEPLAQAQGWGSVRENLFGIEDEMRARVERQRNSPGSSDKSKLRYEPASQTPFRGRLPPAPQSMERRLRNPISQVPAFKEQPITQRQDFLQQMRKGIEKGRLFSDKKTKIQSSLLADDPSVLENEDGLTPAAARTKGQLDLHTSGWHLPSDLATATGLEDIFSGNFKIADEDRPVPTRGGGDLLQPEETKMARAILRKSVLGSLGVLIVGGMAVIMGHSGIRRSVCLWLVGKLEGVGY